MVNPLRIALLAVLFAAACAGPKGGARSDPASALEQEEVLAVATRFLRCIELHDHATGAELSVPTGALVSVRGPSGERRLGGFTLERWVEMLREDAQPGQGKDVAERFVGTPTVLVDGDVAVVWGRYAFQLDGALSHVGTNALTLVRTDQGWKVAGGAYSAEQPPAAPAD